MLYYRCLQNMQTRLSSKWIDRSGNQQRGLADHGDSAVSRIQMIPGATRLETEVQAEGPVAQGGAKPERSAEWVMSR